MRSATEADMRYIASRLTTESLQEIDALSRFQPVSVLLQNMERKGVIVDRRKPDWPLAVFEIFGQPGKPAAYWSALTETALRQDWYWGFNDHVNAILNGMQSQHPTLLTYVDARNVRQMNWLERTGFHHVEDIPQYGRLEMPFKLYRRGAPHV